MKTLNGSNPTELKAVNARQMEATEEIDPEMSLYRHRTVAMLRRYLQLSVELGRVPSLLGREFFRSRVTSYRMHNFEDVVIFVHDVEQCLERLDRVSQQLIARIVLQQYSQEETAKLLGCTGRTVERRYPEAIDRMTRILLDHDLLEEIGGERVRDEDRRTRRQSVPKKPVARVLACQEAENSELVVSS